MLIYTLRPDCGLRSPPTHALVERPSRLLMPGTQAGRLRYGSYLHFEPWN
jgi:hypothetical protein